MQWRPEKHDRRRRLSAVLSVIVLITSCASAPASPVLRDDPAVTTEPSPQLGAEAPTVGARPTADASPPAARPTATTSAPLPTASTTSAAGASSSVAASPSNWPQLGRDAQRTNYSPIQVDPPYCYTWKWYEVPIASRAQPVVANGRLFIGSLNGVMYARDASTGASLWTFTADSPIRHAAGVANDVVVFTSHLGTTYAVDLATGALQWEASTGPSSTAPLIDEDRSRAYVASSDGRLTALNTASGAPIWQYNSGAPILTSPSMSADGQTIFLGNEAIYAIAVRATDGTESWRTRLRGQSLADRYPAVANDVVIYRSQPLDFFHVLLQEGDAVMNRAGPVDPDWAADWAQVRPEIVSYLTSQPDKQTFFVLSANNGASRGVAPMLYTYGDNDIPNVPVVRGANVYVTYRARHGIQTDGGAVHIASQYDAELGQMNIGTLDIAGLQATTPLAGSPQFRMTSDEPSMLTMGGNVLWVDNWERLGGLNVSNGQLVHVGNVSNDWPECFAQCGPGSDNPFFPMTGSGAAYPFPSPRVNEGHQRGGAVIANNMVYWRVIEGGLAGISHRAGSTCPAPLVYTDTPASLPADIRQPGPSDPSRPLADYISLDLTDPVGNPPADLVQALRREISAIVQTDEHLMPYYLERGFSQTFVWPYDVPPGQAGQGLPGIGYEVHGSAYWHDPGELLLTMAMAYPYLDPALQANVRQYMAAEMQRYPPLQDLPWGDSSRDWLRSGRQRELYDVSFRSQLNNWPPVAASMSTLYSLWLWSKNTGDWTYAQAHWNEARSLFNSRRQDMGDFYSDIAGAIGFARMAQHFGFASDYDSAVQAAIGAMEAGRSFSTYMENARNSYLDPRDQATGWYMPVFYGMTPEVGLYLREQTNGQARDHIAAMETGDGLRWWYMTRAGAHAEIGESSYVAPIAAWSYFLAHAYIVGDARDTLTKWLDRPWGVGDLYWIQKTVATLQAGQARPDLSTSAYWASPPAPKMNSVVTFTLSLRNTGGAFTDTVRMTTTLPSGLMYVTRSLTATQGTVADDAAPQLTWSGVFGATPAIVVTYRALVTEADTRALLSHATIESASVGSFARAAIVIANGKTVSLPLVWRSY